MIAIYVVNIDDYLPDLAFFSISTIKQYAERIGAQIEVLKTRQFCEWPIPYEKLQVFERGRSNTWSILIDADMLISPEFHDVTKIFPPDHVGVYMAHNASRLFPADPYFLRDGRNVGLATNFIVTSSLCHDLWTPFNEPPEVVLGRLRAHSDHPHPEHIVDEYCLSRNLARFGLKYSGVAHDELGHILHLNATTDGLKGCIDRAKEFLKKWGMPH